MKKSRGKLMQGVGARLYKLRQHLRYTSSEMAEKMGIVYNSYNRNENEETVPSWSSLFRLLKDFDISMDWLLFNKGPMFYQEKEPGSAGEQAGAGLKELQPEVKELVTNMEKDPTLFHEIMLHFYKYRDAKAGEED